MLHQLLHKIINTRIGKQNFYLATGGLALALFLILVSFFVKHNFNSLKGNKTQYIVITKRINEAMMADVNMSTFSKEEVTVLKNAPFFDSIQGVKTSLFKVKLSVPMATLPLSTDMFFESVPDAYLDVKPKNWDWQPGDISIKMIAPRFFVDMYNYGFAVGQQLPQLSDTTINKIPFDFVISNKEESSQVKFDGNIGGLSNRFFGILVPESFMDWANKYYGFLPFKNPTSIVAKAKNPSDEKLHQFLQVNGYKSDYGTSKYSQYGFVIKIVEQVSLILGLLFLLFALLVLMMHIKLTIANAKEEIYLLKILGTSPKQLQSFLMKKVMPVYIIIISSILILLSLFQYHLATSIKLQQQEIVLPKILPIPIFFVAFFLLLILWGINFWSVKKHINSKH
jgi:hypothetical protein